MLSLMRIGMQPWRDIVSICFEAVPGYLMQISGEGEREGEDSPIRKKKTVGDTLSEGSIHGR